MPIGRAHGRRSHAGIEAGGIPSFVSAANTGFGVLESGHRRTWSYDDHFVTRIGLSIDGPQFSEGDRWVYPYYQLPKDLDLTKYEGLLIRARSVRPSEVRVILWEGDKDIGYLSQNPVIPSDGKWHVAVVRFHDLEISTANAPDPNGRLDLDQVHRISVGMNSRVNDNTLEVSDLYLVRE